MTMVLSAVVGDEVLMCADTLITNSEGAPVCSMPKMSTRSGCCIGTWGSSCFPVHETIRQWDDADNDPLAIAALVRATFWSDPKRTSMSAFIGGFIGCVGVVYRDEDTLAGPVPMVPALGESIRIWSGGRAIPAELATDAVSNCQETMKRMLQVQEQVAQHDSGVGPPFELAILRRGQMPKRFVSNGGCWEPVVPVMGD